MYEKAMTAALDRPGWNSITAITTIENMPIGMEHDRESLDAAILEYQENVESGKIPWERCDTIVVEIDAGPYIKPTEEEMKELDELLTAYPPVAPVHRVKNKK